MDSTESWKWFNEWHTSKESIAFCSLIRASISFSGKWKWEDCSVFLGDGAGRSCTKHAKNMMCSVSTITEREE